MNVKDFKYELEVLIEMKKEFMTTYMDAGGDKAHTSYYEGWLDALDTFETWLKQLEEEV